LTFKILTCDETADESKKIIQEKSCETTKTKNNAQNKRNIRKNCELKLFG